MFSISHKPAESLISEYTEHKMPFYAHNEIGHESSRVIVLLAIW